MADGISEGDSVAGDLDEGRAGSKIPEYPRGKLKLTGANCLVG